MDKLLLITTVVTAIATVVYAYLTYLIVCETRRLREVQAEPEIVLYLQPLEFLPEFLYYIVKNVSAAPAFDLEWSFEDTAPLIALKKVNIDKVKFFQGTKYFAPGQQFISYFGYGRDLLKDPVTPPLEITLKYHNQRGAIFERKFFLDPYDFSGRMYTAQPIQRIADDLHLITEQIRRLSSGFDQLQVNAFIQKEPEDQEASE